MLSWEDRIAQEAYSRDTRQQRAEAGEPYHPDPKDNWTEEDFKEYESVW